MNYILLSLFLLMRHNEAEDVSPKNNTHWNDSFSVKIGAGYEVGTGQSSNSSPKSTTKIEQPQNYLSSILSRETIPIIREPRTLTNSTPQVGSPNLEKMRNQFESKNRFLDSRAAGSSNFAINDIKSYQVREAFTDEDAKHLNIKPSLVDLHKIVNGLDKSKPYSKIVQVIKVPAIYEIHLQSDGDKKSQVNLYPESYNQKENSNWKHHYEANPDFHHINSNDHLNWKNNYETKPNINNFKSELFSDEYLQWLNNYYKDKEDAFSKESHKYSKPITISSLENNMIPEFVDHLQENKFLEPIISHHYSHTKNFDEKLDNSGVYAKYGTDGTKNPSANIWQNRDRYPHRNPYYPHGNLKRDVGGKNVNPVSPFYSSFSKFPPNKNSLHINHKKATLKSKPIKQNQEITEFNHPEAIHEVPAPYLGKHAFPRAFETQSSKTTYSKPIPNAHSTENGPKSNNVIPDIQPQQVIHNIPHLSSSSPPFKKQKPGVVFPDTVYSLISEKNSNHQHNVDLTPETVPTSEEFSSYINENQNLVYGKQTEAVLSPYEINIPITPATTPVTFNDNQETKNHKNTLQHSRYPDINSDYHRSSNDAIHNPNNVLQRISNDQVPENQFHSNHCHQNNIYENVPITTHIPDVNLLKKNQVISNDDVYREKNVKDKPQGVNIKSNQINSTKRISEDGYNNYNNFIIKKSPQPTLYDAVKNIPNQIFTKNRHINKGPLTSTRKQRNEPHLDYIIYITEKTRHDK